MKRWKSFLTTMAVSVAMLIVFFAAIIKDRPTAFSTGSDIVLRWNTLDESSVQHYEVYRRNGTVGDFSLVSSVSKKGDNSSYEFIDRQVFKSQNGIYQYKIRAVNGQTPAPESDLATVSHVSSAAKRTWGSIKAMFR